MSDDTLIGQLTKLGTADPKATKPKKRQPGARKARNRFFFHLDDPSDEQLRRQELSQRPVLPQSDREVIERSESYSKELPESLDPNIKQVRELFLKSIAPLRMAAEAGIHQAKEVLAQASGSEIEDDATELFFNQMLLRGINLRLSKFIAEYLSLPPEDAEKLLGSLNPQRELVFPVPEREHPVRGIEDERSRSRVTSKGSAPVSRATRHSKA